MLKVNDEIKVKIIDLDYKGDGIAKVDDLYIFTPGLLKAEEATIKIISLKKGYALGKVIKLHKKSLERTAETSIFGSINLSHLAFAKQLLWQQQITKTTMEKVLKGTINVSNTVTDNNPYNYRNKVVFHCLYDPFLKLSLYSHNNQQLTVVNNFMLAPKVVNEIILKLNESQILIKNKELLNIIFKTNTNNEVLVTLVSNKEEFKELNQIITFFKSFSNVKGLTLNLKKQKEKILSDKSIVLFGINLLTEGILLLNDQSFMQVNYQVANLVYNLVKDNIFGTKIVDAYCGVGSIGFSVYNEDYQITMIDNNRENIKLAKTIKRDNNFNNVKVVLANAEDVIKDYNPETIILDPPRKGLHTNLINSVISNNIKRVIYLSCDLQTLTRDLKAFSSDYNIINVYPIKMFPQTNAFETLVVLDKKN